mmetsp:Transcript_20319/g.63783  ORF Transcript_20319/g.63783 Transcript_20319/m.63783 type:complete len:501 (-) Transcript_20319:2321-3823(-)
MCSFGLVRWHVGRRVLRHNHGGQVVRGLPGRPGARAAPVWAPVAGGDHPQLHRIRGREHALRPVRRRPQRGCVHASVHDRAGAGLSAAERHQRCPAPRQQRDHRGRLLLLPALVGDAAQLVLAHHVACTARRRDGGHAHVVVDPPLDPDPVRAARRRVAHDPPCQRVWRAGDTQGDAAALRLPAQLPPRLALHALAQPVFRGPHHRDPVRGQQPGPLPRHAFHRHHSRRHGLRDGRIPVARLPTAGRAGRGVDRAHLANPSAPVLLARRAARLHQLLRGVHALVLPVRGSILVLLDHGDQGRSRRSPSAARRGAQHAARPGGRRLVPFAQGHRVGPPYLGPGGRSVRQPAAHAGGSAPSAHRAPSGPAHDQPGHHSGGRLHQPLGREGRELAAVGGAQLHPGRLRPPDGRAHRLLHRSRPPLCVPRLGPGALRSPPDVAEGDGQPGAHGCHRGGARAQERLQYGRDRRRQAAQPRHQGPVRIGNLGGRDVPAAPRALPEE